MPVKTRTIPISHSMLGRKSAIHHGVRAPQSTRDGLPVAKYPYSQRAIPASSMSQPMMAAFLKIWLAPWPKPSRLAAGELLGALCVGTLHVNFL